MQVTLSEENYLKAIYHLSADHKAPVNTNSIAQSTQNTAASVTDMLKKLTEKELVIYEKYKGVRLSEKGRKIAVSIVRKHRLWETFMVEKLQFAWDEVHEVAEQLEHVRSEKLIDALDTFLNHPKYDPHGDPIPSKDGILANKHRPLLSALEIGQSAVIVGVKEHSSDFLKYLAHQKLILGTSFKLISKFDFDLSYQIELLNGEKISISSKVAQNIITEPK